MLKAAVSRGHRPTTLLRGKQPYSKWSDLDRLLLVTWQIYEDEKSTTSGLPYWVTNNDEIGLKLETMIDPGDEMLAKFDADMAKKKDGPPKGQRRYLVPVDDNELPVEYGGLTRQQFQQAAIQDSQDRTDEDNDFPDDVVDYTKGRRSKDFDPSEYGDG